MKSKIIFLILFLILLVSCAQQPEHINVDILKNGDTSRIITENVNYFEK